MESSKDTLKRYLVFVGSDFYPGGGWEDFVGSFATKEEALAYAGEKVHSTKYLGWSQIIDLETIDGKPK